MLFRSFVDFLCFENHLWFESWLQNAMLSMIMYTKSWIFSLIVSNYGASSNYYFWSFLLKFFQVTTFCSFYWCWSLWLWTSTIICHTQSFATIFKAPHKLDVYVNLTKNVQPIKTRKCEWKFNKVYQYLWLTSISNWFEPMCEANKKMKMVNYKICYITKRGKSYWCNSLILWSSILGFKSV